MSARYVWKILYRGLDSMDQAQRGSYNKDQGLTFLYTD